MCGNGRLESTAAKISRFEAHFRHGVELCIGEGSPGARSKATIHQWATEHDPQRGMCVIRKTNRRRRYGVDQLLRKGEKRAPSPY